MNAPVRNHPKPTDQVRVSLTRAEATALCRAAETGVRVTEALSLANSTSAMQAALGKLREAL